MHDFTIAATEVFDVDLATDQQSTKTSVLV